MAEVPKRPADRAQPMTSQQMKPTKAAVLTGATAKASDSIPLSVGPFAVLPTQFGRYRIEKLLGKGAMGAVYLAHDVQLDRPVALKVARISTAGSAKLIKRMETEAKAAAKIDHPLVCKVYDFGEIDGIRFIALQYIEGEDLKSYFTRVGRKQEPAQALRLVLQMSRALAAAHDKGVIHRDLKPENVMLNQSGEPVIMDFGLARRLTGATNAGLTQGMILGTAAYMSPEQAIGKAEGIDHRSDLYAIGVMFFEMLTGEWPFTGSAMELMGQKSVNEAPSALSLDHNIPPQLAAVCDALIAKKKEDRFTTCAELVAALEAVDLNAPVAPDLNLDVPAEPCSTFTAVIPPERPDWHKRKTAGRRGGNATPIARPVSAIAIWQRIQANSSRWMILAFSCSVAMLSAAYTFFRIGDAKFAETKINTIRLVSTIASRESQVNAKTEGELPIGESIDLLAMVKVPDHGMIGNWKRIGDALVCEAVPNGGFIAPVVLIGSYQLRCKFTRRTGRDGVGVFLPVGQSGCLLMIDGWGGIGSGVGRVDGKEIPGLLGTSAVVRQSRPRANGVIHDLVVNVSLDKQSVTIGAALDGDPLTSWTGTVSQLTCHAMNQHSPGGYASFSAVVFHELKLELKPGCRGIQLRDDWKNALFVVGDRPTSGVAASCLEWNGRKYFLSGIPLTFPESQHLATQLNGRLLTISSIEEEKFIRERLPGLNIWMAGWRPFSTPKAWRDERNRPLRYFGKWALGNPGYQQYETQLYIETTAGNRAGWHDAVYEDPAVYACIEWGEEYPNMATRDSAPVTDSLSWNEKVDSSQDMRNTDFKDGLNGWILEGGAANFNLFDSGDHKGISTYGKNQDADTGRISQSFKVPSDATDLEWYVRGYQRPDVRVSLVQNRRIIHTSSAPNSNTPVRVSWSLRPFRGQFVTLEIVDRDRGLRGFIGANGFKILRDGITRSASSPGTIPQ